MYRRITKKPAYRDASAAGKCLIQMDLPLAWCEPSPPYCLREAMRLARRCPSTLPKPRTLRPDHVATTGARFQIVGLAHRRKFTLTRAKTRNARTGLMKEQLQCPSATPCALISCAQGKVKKRMAFWAIFLKIFSERRYLAESNNISDGSRPDWRHAAT